MFGHSLSARGFFLIGLALVLVGCASSLPTQEQIENGDYGPSPQNYEKEIRDYFASTLKDPYSAHISIEEPYKGYLTKAPIAGGGIKAFGWLVKVEVNAKNSYGAYTGSKGYTFFYKNGEWSIPFGPY